MSHNPPGGSVAGISEAVSSPTEEILSYESSVVSGKGSNEDGVGGAGATGTRDKEGDGAF